MTRVRWTPEAADQLEAIVLHIQKNDTEAALNVARSILDRIGDLKTFPAIGRRGEREGTRELVFAPYVIVYRLKDDVAEILHIWHGAQDWR